MEMVWRLREVVKVSPPKRQVDSSNPTVDALDNRPVFGNCVAQIGWVVKPVTLVPPS